MASVLESSAIAQLLKRCRQGDEKSWAALVDQYQRLVYSVARRMGLSEDDSADIFLVTFTVLYQNLDRIENPQTLGKWLAVTAARECLKVKRIASSHSPTAAWDDLATIVESEDASAEELAIIALKAELLWKAVDHLGERCRNLLKSLYMHEKSYDSIAETDGIPIGTIGPTRSRCLEKLKKDLELSGFFH